MEFGILGPLVVSDRGRPVPIGATKLRVLLAALLLRHGQTVPVDWLVACLWGDAPPSTAANTLQAHVSRLRKVLGLDRSPGGPVLLGARNGYALTVDADHLDLGRFDRLVTAARQAGAAGSLGDAASRLREALALWRGSALEDIDSQLLRQTEAPMLAERHLAVLGERIDLELSLGRHRELLPELTALTAERPLDERMWERLMLALYRSGRQADALSAFQRVRGVLVEEIGVEPGLELQRLERAILCGDPTLDAAGAADAAAIRAGPPGPTNLPLRQHNAFVGRDRELAELRGLVPEVAAVTLTGPGGCGKSRLAIQIASALRPLYPDGVWLVELAAVTDPALVSQTIAATLGAAGRAGRSSERLAGWLRSRRLLLVLDNCEHLLAGCAELVKVLVHGCPGVRLLVTSREPLGVPGEVVRQVPALQTPGADDQTVAGVIRSEAGRLFAARAAAVVPGFTVTPANAAGVGRICRSLDGMPLGIELTAARLRILSVEQIATRLDTQLLALVDGARDAHPRHRSLRATIDWSYDLLNDPQRRLFDRLGVFAGGFTLPAAEAVGCDGEAQRRDTPQHGVLGLLGDLVDKSLVDVAGRDGEPRYRLLEPLRQYAAERLGRRGDAAATRRQHAAYFVRLAEEAERERRGPRRGDWLDRLRVERGNIRAALRWCIETGDAACGQRLAAALWWFWTETPREGLEWTRAVLALGDTQTSLLARAHLGAGILAHHLGEYAQVTEHCGEALVLCERAGDQHGTLVALIALGSAVCEQGGARKAARLHRRALRIADKLGDRYAEARCLVSLSTDVSYLGQHDRAHKLLEQALELFRQLGDEVGIAEAFLLLGEVAQRQGRPARATELLRSALPRLRERGEKGDVARVMLGLGWAAHEQGAFDEATTWLERALGGFGEVGDRQWVALTLDRLADVAITRRHAARAVTLLGAVDVLRGESRGPIPTGTPVDRERTLTRLRADLGDDSFAVAWLRGTSMTLDAAAAFGRDGAEVAWVGGL